MSILFVIGRIAFVIIFILSGAQKLMDIPATAEMIGAKFTVPVPFESVATQIEGVTRMTIPQLLAIASGVIEIGAALMIAANIGARLGALVLLLFTGVATFYFHDFWNMEGVARTENMVNALKNLSIIGALLVFFVLGSWRPSDAAFGDAGAQPRY
jgi:putative oxidoreductase